MKLFYKSWGLVGALLCLGLASSAFGQTTLLFNNPNGNSYGGEETSPYNFTINGSSVQLICDSTANLISDGESWQANVYNGNTVVGNGLWNTATAAQYSEASALAYELLNGLDDPGITPSEISDDGAANLNELLSWAIWDIFIPNDGPNGLNPTQKSDADADISTLLLWAAGHENYNTDVVFFTPIPGTQTGTLGTPQEFIGLTSSTPEASSAAVLGLDLFAFGGVVLFFRRRASRAA
jgi:hypothetical protein